MMNGTNLKHGEARLEFVACRERIEEMLLKGHSISSIHKILHESGVITMSYKTLQDKIKKIGKAPHGVSTLKQFAAPPRGCETAPVPTVQLKELDEAMEVAAAKRSKEPKKNDGVHQPYSRKKVIG
jgi:hypothetical protein